MAAAIGIPEDRSQRARVSAKAEPAFTRETGDFIEYKNDIDSDGNCFDAPAFFEALKSLDHESG
jgi:hypothetical protein